MTSKTRADSGKRKKKRRSRNKTIEIVEEKTAKQKDEPKIKKTRRARKDRDVSRDTDEENTRRNDRKGTKRLKREFILWLFEDGNR